MAVLEKIRVRMGVFITVIIGLALISFIVDANTLSSITSMFSSQNDVGKINGKTISYQDFIKRQEYYVQINTLFTGNTSLSEEMQEQVNDQVWQDFFREEVLDPQYQKSGIELSAKELVDLAQGRNISPVLQRDPVFWGETGAFSRTNVINFIQNIANDPSGRTAVYWKYCENRMRAAQLMEKYLSLLTQSRYSNSLELKRAVTDRNTTIDIRYVAQSANAVRDSLAIGESDLRAYYKKHKKDFEQSADERDIEFVAFPVEPSDEDIRRTEESIDKIYSEFASVKTADLGSFVSRNSDEPFTGYYYKKDELPAKIDSFIFRATAKDILPVFRDDNTFYTARIVHSRMMPDSVQVRHILLQNTNKAAANKLADSLITVINRGANFGYIAQQYSADQAANRKEGDIGWFNQKSSIIKEFKDTCFVIPKNKLVKLETNFGVHVVEVTNRSPEERRIQVALVERTAHPGKITYQNIFADANSLSTASNNQIAQFKTAAAAKNLTVVPAYSLREGQRSIAVLPNANTRELARWAYGATVGSVSSVLTIDNYFVVATLATVRKQGTLSFDQVRSEIEGVLQAERKIAQAAQKLQDATAGAATMDEVAEKINVPVTTAANISFAGNSFITGAGLEPKLQGAVVGAAENVLTGPVKGSLGAYLFTVTRRYTGAAYTLEEEKMREQYLEKYDQMTLMQRYTEFYNVLQKMANVQDWRGRFF